MNFSKRHQWKGSNVEKEKKNITLRRQKSEPYGNPSAPSSARISLYHNFNLALHRSKSVNSNLKRRKLKEIWTRVELVWSSVKKEMLGGIGRFLGEISPRIHLLIHRLLFRKKDLASKKIVNCGAVAMGK